MYGDFRELIKWLPVEMYKNITNELSIKYSSFPLVPNEEVAEALEKLKEDFIVSVDSTIKELRGE